MPARRYETIQWVFFQMAFIGPMFGQVGYFHKFAGQGHSPTSGRSSAIATSPSACSACWRRGLSGRPWIMGDDYTIADISMLGWVRNLIGFYGARDLVEFDTPAECAGLAGARILNDPRSNAGSIFQAAFSLSVRWVVFG